MFGILSEGEARFAVFAGVFAIMAAWELLAPLRPLSQSKARRWATNLTIGGLGALTARLMGLFFVPLAAIAAAIWAEGAGFGLFNLTGLPGWLEILLAVVILDLAIYAQHVASHHVPVLWRLHRMHHADPDFDVTTAVRFHPIEIGLSMLWKIAVVLALGASAFAVFLFEVILNACAMFNHSNVRLPAGLDRVLRRVIVTPDMHRVHHSVIRREHDSNFGFNLAIWDRLFGTYQAQPEAGHQGMVIGLADTQDERPTRLSWSLAMPFLNRLRRPAAEARADSPVAGPAE